MGINYTLIASVMLFFVTANSFESRSMSIRFASLIVTIIPFTFSETLRYIVLRAYHAPLGQLISVSIVTILALQIMTAFGVFYKLRTAEETYVDWYAWMIGGMVVLYFVIPFAVHSLLPGW